MIFHFILDARPFRGSGERKNLFEDRRHECDKHLEHSEIDLIGGTKYDICVWTVERGPGVCDGRRLPFDWEDNSLVGGHDAWILVVWVESMLLLKLAIRETGDKVNITGFAEPME